MGSTPGNLLPGVLNFRAWALVENDRKAMTSIPTASLGGMVPLLRACKFVSRPEPNMDTVQ